MDIHFGNSNHILFQSLNTTKLDNLDDLRCAN